VQPALVSNAADYRQMVPAEGCPEHWGFAPRGIGLDHQGQQVAAALVYEDDGPAFLPGLFSGRASFPLSSAGWPPVPLAGPFQRLLAAPPILFEDASHLGRVVLDPEVASDDLGHPGLGPDVAGPAIPVAVAAAGGPIWAGDREVCSGVGLGGHGPWPG
jgi:hypothetical protein